MGPISYNKAAEAAKQLEVNRQSEKSPKPKGENALRFYSLIPVIEGRNCMY